MKNANNRRLFPRLCASTLALSLLRGLALPASTASAADSTNSSAPEITGQVPTKSVVPPEWKVNGEPKDYNFDGLPLAEVAHTLRDQYKEQFDVLIPRDVAIPTAFPVVGPDGKPVPPEHVDGTLIAVTMRLKHVSLTEVFQAMNMQWELEGKPYRWKLVMNGQRPVAALHVLYEDAALSMPGEASPGGGQSKSLSRAVVFVGNLLVGASGGGETMKADTLCKTLEDTSQQTFPDSKTCKIKFHPGAELVVISGTTEEVEFMKDVLAALTERANFKAK